MAMRKIIEINEDLCDGCGQCIVDCAESALEIVDDKAKLVRDMYCDGLGACLEGCPTGALKIIEREAEDFDEEAVNARTVLQKAGSPAAAPTGGCPGHVATELQPAAFSGGCPGQAAQALPSQAPMGPGVIQSEGSSLGHWPIKLQLLNPAAPFLKGADLLLLADCSGTSMPNLHAAMLKGKAIALACPKLDDAEAHVDKLAMILKQAQPQSLTSVIMEVPCCRGLDFIAQEAVKRAGVKTSLHTVVIARTGQILEDTRTPAEMA